MPVEQLDNFDLAHDKETSESSKEKNSYIKFLMRETFDQIRQIEKMQKSTSQATFDIEDLHRLMKVWPLNFFDDLYEKDITKSQAQHVIKKQIRDCIEEIYQNKQDELGKMALLHLLDQAVDKASAKLIEKGTFKDDESTKYYAKDNTVKKYTKIEFSDN